MTNIEIVETIEGEYAVLVNGFQWGPATSTPDSSGAYPDTWPTPEAARAAYNAARA